MFYISKELTTNYPKSVRCHSPMVSSGQANIFSAFLYYLCQENRIFTRIKPGLLHRPEVPYPTLHCQGKVKTCSRLNPRVLRLEDRCLKLTGEGHRKLFKSMVWESDRLSLNPSLAMYWLCGLRKCPDISVLHGV